MYGIKSYSNLSKEYNGLPVVKFRTEFSESFINNLSEAILSQVWSYLSQGSASTFLDCFSVCKFEGWNKVGLLDSLASECHQVNDIFMQGLEIYLEEFQAQYRRFRPDYLFYFPNIMRNYDGETKPHMHHINPFNVAGVYYLSGDFQKKLMKTVFYPNGSDRAVKKIFTASQGDILMFPANLPHQIPSYPSDQLRITIGFDFVFDPKKNRAEKFFKKFRAFD